MSPGASHILGQLFPQLPCQFLPAAGLGAGTAGRPRFSTGLEGLHRRRRNIRAMVTHAPPVRGEASREATIPKYSSSTCSCPRLESSSSSLHSPGCLSPWDIQLLGVGLTKAHLPAALIPLLQPPLPFPIPWDCLPVHFMGMEIQESLQLCRLPLGPACCYTQSREGKNANVLSA